MKVLWATRGRDWGFRFLRKGGLSDPLEAYEDTFASVGSAEEIAVRVGDTFAVRLPDPKGRRDRSGRPIPHEFVIWGSGIDSTADARAVALQAVEDEYTDEVWAALRPPEPLR